ncbi:MAG: ATP-binding protein [Lachnospiraceae bacterium]
MKRKIEEKLFQWKQKKNRKPLILNGARQVGKTYILRAFGEKYYKNMVYVNLEINETIASFFESNIAPERLIQYLEASTGERIVPGETLIILDEIQACERALTSLKYFCEDTPEYHIVAAGSLLGVAINRARYSFPVGKVETMTLYSLDFEEFLWAMKEDFLCNEIRNSYKGMTALVEALHQKAIERYRQYLIVGGMPACINQFMESGKLLDIPLVQNEIMNNYLADMAKYAENASSVKIRACFNSIQAQLAKENKKFQYKVVQKGGTATIFGEAIEWLNAAGVVLKCQKTEQGNEPVSAYVDLASFKLYMCDVGLLVMKSGIMQQTILSGMGNTFLGAVTENYVATQLAANGYDLFYWESEYSAELDFVTFDQSGRYAIEVKKGEHNKSKSLNQFIKKYNPENVYRFSLKNFGYENGIHAVPLYAIFCMEKK